MSRHKTSRSLFNIRGLGWQLRGAAWMAVTILGAAGAEGPAASQFRKQVEPILKEYCYDCHGDGASKGKIAFDELRSNESLMNHDLWLKVLNNVRAGLMPPEKKPKPSAAQKTVLEQWIKYGAFGIDARDPDPGRVTVRRLNRVEYRNTIRDLMGVDFNTLGEFPPDDTGYGFDTIGDVLTVSPMLLEKYLAAARQVVSEAVPMVSRVLPERIIPGSRFSGLDIGGGGRRRNGNGNGARDPGLSLSFYQPAAVSNSFTLDVAGDYRLNLELAVKGDFEFDPGRCRVAVTVDGREVFRQEFGWYNGKSFPQEFPGRLEAGRHEVAVTLEPLVPVEKKLRNLDFRVVGLAVRGPLDEKLWTKPPRYDDFFSRDEAPKNPRERAAYAREVLRNFATKAFRRPPDSATLDRLTALAEGVYTQPDKTFEAGVAHAMVGVLASPWFIFRAEETLKSSSSDKWALVDEYSLASRLSYFLWSSTPDAELLELAGKGGLRANLAAQVKRMLADPKSASLSQNFTGQWLQARDVESLSIDARAVFAREAVPMLVTNAPVDPIDAARLTNALAAAAGNLKRANFGNVNRRGSAPRVQLDENMKLSMRRETEMYFAGIVQEDRSVLELIESDYTFINSNLARVYGLTNLDVQGSELRRVVLPPGSPRGGILTGGTVLAVTSNPDRTSPVKRGLFILDNILGTPVPPAPPNVPALELSEKDFKDHQPTLREALQIHRENALCASCHSRMDPIGLGMENFNALGAWRENERGQRIETAGKLITGETFQSVQELKHLLATTHKSEFYRCLTEKLMTYALGRGMEYYDVETTDRIVARMERENGRFSALLMGVIESAPFQKRRLRAQDAYSENRDSAPPPAGLAKNLKKTP